jgi:type 1 glutamine amidotransferase
MLRLSLAFSLFVAALAAADAKIVLLAGKPSHPPRMHEYNAGMILLATCLRQNPGVQPVVVQGGWPEDESVFQEARAVVLFMDGRARHEVLPHMETMAALMRKGVGLACLHYAVDVPPEKAGPQFLDWLGGFYEVNYSTNPINDASMAKASPKHPISAGWDSFQLKDEWYYRIRFRPEDKRVTPILTTMLPKEAPEKQVVAWAVQREDGGRGFGYTGAHFHDNWGREEPRRLVTNALLWVARAAIPAGGARCSIEPGDLDRNLDDKPAPRPNPKSSR